MPPEFNISTQELIKVGIAIICGALLGFERQYKNKTAGFRTIMLICLGSALFTMVAQQTGQLVNINIVTGIGFIGAGVIFKDGVSVNGLTTAAVIWISAAIGMAAGSGNYTLALISTVVTLFVLVLFHFIENYIDKVHHERILFVVFQNDEFTNLLRLEDVIHKHHLASRRRLIAKRDGRLEATIVVLGHKKHISKLDEKLLIMPEIKAF